MDSRLGSKPIVETFDIYLSDKSKGKASESGNYRRNVARELEKFHDWLSQEVSSEKSEGEDSQPTFEDVDEHTFRKYARHLAAERGLKQNSIKTYYAFISGWCGWCVTEGYLDAHYARRVGATAPLPEDDGRRPGDQQAWSDEHRYELTHHVDETARDAIEEFTALPQRGEEEAKQRARYTALKATRDRALVYLISYTAVRIGEVLRDPNDPRRRGLRWEDVSLDEGRMTVYRKKQQWDAVGLPEPVIQPLLSYQKIMDPPSDQWPVFPTFDHRTLGSLVESELSDRGNKPDEIEARRDEFVYDFMLALDADIRPQAITTEGGRALLQRLTDAAGIEINHPKHDYLAPHGARRGMGEVLVRAFGYTVAARYLDNSEEMVRERYSHIDAGKLGDKVSEALD